MKKLVLAVSLGMLSGAVVAEPWDWGSKASYEKAFADANRPRSGGSVGERELGAEQIVEAQERALLQREGLRPVGRSPLEGHAMGRHVGLQRFAAVDAQRSAFADRLVRDALAKDPAYSDRWDRLINLGGVMALIDDDLIDPQRIHVHEGLLSQERMSQGRAPVAPDGGDVKACRLVKGTGATYFEMDTATAADLLPRFRLTASEACLSGDALATFQRDRLKSLQSSNGGFARAPATEYDDPWVLQHLRFDEAK